MTSHLPPSGETRPTYYYTQSAVIPFRRHGGGLEILMITSRKKKRWVLPKGIVEPELSAWDSAAKEALEEAGIEGAVSRESCGTYRYPKWGGTCTVAVFTMRVETVHETWLESFRERRWVSLDEAVARVREEGLKQILRALPGGLPPAPRSCAFLTLAEPGDYVIDDEHAYQPLGELGWQVEAVPWNRPDVAWEAYDLVVIRSSWDYTLDLDGFLAVLAEIERRGVRLENPLPLVRWNLYKTYLRDLAARGVATVPTVWRDRLRPGDLAALFAEVASDEVVIKPVVGANAEGAYRLDARAVRARAGEVEAYYAERALQAQPLARAVLDEGEYSLVYFNGEHSHTILKTPKSEDFRVQEEHGGIIRAVRGDGALHRAGRQTLEALDEAPLYMRADFVRANGGGESPRRGANETRPRRGADGRYWLMELELVEPSLYLRMDPEAPGRFARALDARFVAREPISMPP